MGRAAHLLGAVQVGAQFALILDGMYVNAAHLGPNGPAAAGRALALAVLGDPR